MSYIFNPHRHVKIWLSKDKDSFLNLENQIRLAKMREINPQDEIYFIYDSALLSRQALTELESFCARYKIIAKDVRIDVIPQCTSVEEKKLISIYEENISKFYKNWYLDLNDDEDNLTTEEKVKLAKELAEKAKNIAIAGGNLAVGSDILRFLEPVYKLGTYSDFDVQVDTRALADTIPVEKPLLISLGSFTPFDDIKFAEQHSETEKTNTDSLSRFASADNLSQGQHRSLSLQRDIQHISVNNHTIAVVDYKDALPEITNIQRTMIERCSKQLLVAKNKTSFYARSKSDYLNELKKFFPGQLVDVLSRSNPFIKILQEFEKEAMVKTACQLRELIIAERENNVIFFAKGILKNQQIAISPQQTPEEIIQQAACLVRKQLSSADPQISAHALQELRDLAAIENDEEFLTRLSKQELMQILKTIVIFTTGPMAVTAGLFGNTFYEKEAFAKEIAPYSFAYYDLDNIFFSAQNLPLYASLETTSKILQAKQGEANDLSWLSEGQKTIADREEKIREAQALIPKRFQQLHEEIEIHLSLLNSTIKPLSFYSNKESHMEITTLNEVLTCFKEHYFDVDRFKKLIENQVKPEVFSSKVENYNRTKELIDNLVTLSEQAKNYLLTNSQGQIAFRSLATDVLLKKP